MKCIDGERERNYLIVALASKQIHERFLFCCGGRFCEADAESRIMLGAGLGSKFCCGFDVPAMKADSGNPFGDSDGIVGKPV
jgi:hypothetical protein